MFLRGWRKSDNLEKKTQGEHVQILAESNVRSGPNSRPWVLCLIMKTEDMLARVRIIISQSVAPDFDCE